MRVRSVLAALAPAAAAVATTSGVAAADDINVILDEHNVTINCSTGEDNGISIPIGVGC
ncbi:hypothetical protein [Streptomyces sp. NPDC053720]|uniref:hypothetical protein n=1 Tax=Streptomyces sp. NPDC053720 TaxID=3154855 RepID=UPI0034165224